MTRATSMTTAKRWIAVVAALLLLGVGASTLGLLSFTVAENGTGADPADAFQDSELLLANVSWGPDAADLARPIDQATRDDLGSAWVRSQDALGRAADGDLSGLDAWFVDGALRRALDRYEAASPGSVSAPSATSHELRVQFVSLDGQIAVLDVRSRSTDGRTSRSTVVMVVDASSWRVRAITASHDV